MSPSDKTADQRKWHMNGKDRGGLKELQRTDPRDDKKQIEDATSAGPSLPKADETVHSRPRSQADISSPLPNSKAQVLYDFAGQRENELSITAGDFIEVVQKGDDGKGFSYNLLIARSSH